MLPGRGGKHHKRAMFYFFSNPMILFDHSDCDSGQKNLCRLGKTVTQQFGNTKPKSLTFVCFWTQIFQEKVDKNEEKIAGRDLVCSLHASVLSGGSCCRHRCPRAKLLSLVSPDWSSPLALGLHLHSCSHNLSQSWQNDPVYGKSSIKKAIKQTEVSWLN